MAINKIKEEELKSLQEKVGIQQNLQSQVGQLELQKFFLLNSAAKNQQDLLEEQKKLEEEYGKVNINLQDGSYEEIEEKEEK
jgi:hypothetical protein|tara:strand:+ start:628 stop:873 length:246 start_codon:yes stop_codon:yes gene_type:complete